MKSLEKTSTALFKWVDNNIVKRNLNKYRLIISSIENVTVHVFALHQKFSIKDFFSKCEQIRSFLRFVHIY